MPVPVVDIRKMRVAMCERLMRMEMCMRLFPIPRKVVLVLMVRVVAMPMTPRRASAKSRSIEPSADDATGTFGGF